MVHIVIRLNGKYTVEHSMTVSLVMPTPKQSKQDVLTISAAYGSPFVDHSSILLCHCATLCLQ